MYFTFRGNQRVREEILARDIGTVPWARRERKMVWWNTCEGPKGKWNSVAKNTCIDLDETGHPIFKGVSAMNRGVLKRRKNERIHFHCGNFKRWNSLFQLIHSANQLSISRSSSNLEVYSTVPKETEPISEKFVTSEASVNTETPKRVHSEEEWNSLVGSGQVHACLCGERDMLQSSSKTWTCMDGFGGLTPSCREDSRLRGEAGSNNFLVQLQKELWLDQCYNLLWWKFVGNYEFEMEILSSTRSGKISWVEEWIAMWTKYLFQSRDTTTSAKIWLQKEAVENTEPCPTEWRQSGTEETRATSRVGVQKKRYATHSKHNSHQGKKVEVVLELKGHHTPLNPTMSMFRNDITTLRSRRKRFWWSDALGT